jgi:hypothetical protein
LHMRPPSWQCGLVQFDPCTSTNGVLGACGRHHIPQVGWAGSTFLASRPRSNSSSQAGWSLCLVQRGPVMYVVNQTVHAQFFVWHSVGAPQCYSWDRFLDLCAPVSCAAGLSAWYLGLHCSSSSPVTAAAPFLIHPTAVHYVNATELCYRLVGYLRLVSLWWSCGQVPSRCR